ncbi:MULTISPECIES: helix-turn-helix transcriptional regulator [unclassified Streptomyces]|jgi:transcriptional regulator with XRE-family HTH domain|uniref:helix-turn-helix transcriptional regulator n=1 Tax=unclassified Streptomyces TaxID=2593676 RepID=UPI00117C392C|nr:MULTISPECIES: helix-turn-helix transcriptional regulator [unclassified Streptomyces]TRO58967.1 helix-turn-helix domain-containing protein [Streptomyces sp. IB201691-2A2]
MTPQPQNGTELGRFLRARRARVTPGQAGLPTGAGPRRTPGLRREELATLTGISIDYYTRLERGKETRPSPSVVDALARGLLLEQDEIDHLRNLAALAARRPPEPPAAPSRAVRPGVRLLLESLRPSPAYVVSRTNDLLAANPAGLRLFAGIEEWPVKQRNIARYVFLHPAARDLFHDWGTQVRACVAHLRALAGTDPDSPDLTRLVGELLLKSPEFARLWERYDVRSRSYGRKTFHHPEVGELTLGFESLRLEGTPGHRLLAYNAEPGTPEHDAVALLDLLAHEPASRPATPGTASSASS